MGELDITFNDKVHHLQSGEAITIPPRTRHHAVGNETWIRVRSNPGWTPKDHILVVDKTEVSRQNYDADTQNVGV